MLRPCLDRCAGPILVPYVTSLPAAMPARPSTPTSAPADVSFHPGRGSDTVPLAVPCLLPDGQPLPSAAGDIARKSLRWHATAQRGLTLCVNRRHARVGHVFQGRFKAVLVERDSYLLELCRYVVLKPVRAGMVMQLERYRWSSYRATAGLVKAPEWLTREWILGQFCSQPRRAESQYRQFVQDGIGAASPWSQVQGQVV